MRPAASLPSVTIVTVLSRVNGAPPMMCSVSGCGMSRGVASKVRAVRAAGVAAVVAGVGATPEDYV